MSDIIRAILQGIIEGITEFLPVSSTGHLMLASKAGLAIRNKEFNETFEIFIQIGAIAAVVVYFRQRIVDLLSGRTSAASAGGGFGRTRGMTPLEISRSVGAAQTAAPLSPGQRLHAVKMIILATVPVLVIAYLGQRVPAIANLKGNPIAIGLALLLGGLAMLAVEALPNNATTRSVEEITFGQALAIGLVQVLAAIFPGTSRSAATIMGGLAAGLSRPAATEFSFFLAIPAMSAACGYSLLKWLRAGHATVDDFLLLGVGTVVSFLVAWVVIAAFMGYVRKHSFVPFALYRIALALVVFATVWASR